MNHRPYPAAMNQDTTIRGILADAIRNCPKKRLQIAEEMTASLGIKITEAMLNAYTSDAHNRYRWPLAWTCAFCQVTGDNRLVTVVGECLGLMVCSEDERLLLELGREYLRRKEADQKVSDLEARITRRPK
jgi:hypothetical protein